MEVNFGGAPTYAASGSCYMCRTAPEGVWVRTNIDIAYEGELDICGQCAKEIGRAAGLMDPEALSEALKDIEKLKERITVLEPRAEAFNRVMSDVEKLKGNDDVEPHPAATQPRQKGVPRMARREPQSS
jgi:hypothetical protein